MEKIVIIDSEKDAENEHPIDILFAEREFELEKTLPKRNDFIKENNLQKPTHNEIIEEIQDLVGIDEDKKELILKKIDKLLDNRSRIQSFDCKLYYKAGVRDAVEILKG